MAYEFDWSSIPGSLPFLAEGMLVSLEITAVALVVGMVWGTVLALMRLSPVAPLRWFATGYINLFRSVPLVMVLLPMAFRLIVPPLTSEFLNIFKNSAVCSTIGLLELAAQGRQLVDYTAQPYESFIAVTVMYLLINVVVMTLMGWLERRVKVPGYMGQ